MHTASSPTGPHFEECSFALDCEWARELIERIATGFEKAAEFIDRNAKLFAEVVTKILNLQLPVPDAVKQAIQAGVEAVQRMLASVLRLGAKVVVLAKQLLGPWQIRSAGTNILDCVADKSNDFASYLQVANLASTRTWQSPAATEFRAIVADNEETGKGVASGVRAFGMAVKDVGDKGVEITLSFIHEFVAAVAAIITAAAGLPTVAGTAPSAAAILTLVAEIMAAIALLIKKAEEISTSAAGFDTAARGSVPEGYWPDHVNQ